MNLVTRRRIATSVGFAICEICLIQKEVFNLEDVFVEGRFVETCGLWNAF